MLLVLLPFTSSILPSEYERMLTTACLGISLDVRSPWIMLLIMIVASILCLFCFASILYAFCRLYESRSPLSRSTFETISAFEYYHLHKEQQNIQRIPRTPSCWSKLLFAMCPNCLDLLHKIGNLGLLVRGTLWNSLLTMANGGLATFENRPVNINNVKESIRFNRNIQLGLHALTLWIPTMVSGMALVARCVACEDDGNQQWIGIELCGSSNQLFVTMFITLLAPLTAVLAMIVCIYPTVVILHNFYSQHSVGGIHSESTYQQVRVEYSYWILSVMYLRLFFSYLTVSLLSLSLLLFFFFFFYCYYFFFLHASLAGLFVPPSW